MYSLVSQIDNKKFNNSYQNFTTKKSNQEIPHNDLEIFTTDKNNNIRLIANQTITLISKFSAKSKSISVSALKFNDKFNSLFVGYTDGTLEIYKSSSMTNNKITLKPHFSRINHISFSNDQTQMITSSNDKSIKIFKLKKTGSQVTPQFLQSLTSHNQLVLKSEFSTDSHLIFSIDKSVFKVTSVSKQHVSKKDNQKVTNQINDKQVVFQMKCDQDDQIFDFYQVNEHLVFLAYKNGLFELVDINLEEKIRSFKIGNDLQLLQVDYGYDCQKSCCLVLDLLDQQKKILVFDFLDFQNQDLFEMKVDSDVQEIKFTTKGGYIVLTHSKHILIFKNTLLEKPKNLLQKISKVKKTIPPPEEIQEEKEDLTNKPEYQIISENLSKFSLSLQQITECFIQLDQKLQKNEKRTELLMNKIQKKSEQNSQIEKSVQEETLKEIEDPSIRFMNYQINNNVDLYETEKHLKNMMNTESVNEDFDLDKVQEFINERSEENFSFKREEDNVFEGVLGKTLNEKTVSFQDDFEITKLQTKILETQNLKIKPEDLNYTQQQIKLILKSVLLKQTPKSARVQINKCPCKNFMVLSIQSLVFSFFHFLFLFFHPIFTLVQKHFPTILNFSPIVICECQIFSPSIPNWY